MDTDDLLHDENQQVCHSYGGQLPEPRDEGENKFLDSLGTGAFLLGMTDTETEGQWVWDSDGSEVNWKNWMDWSTDSDEPYRGDEENCVVMAQDMWNNIAGHKSDGWVDVPCDDSGYYIGIQHGSKATSLICERNPGLFK